MGRRLLKNVGVEQGRAGSQVALLTLCQHAQGDTEDVKPARRVDADRDMYRIGLCNRFVNHAPWQIQGIPSMDEHLVTLGADEFCTDAKPFISQGKRCLPLEQPPCFAACDLHDKRYTWMGLFLVSLSLLMRQELCTCT